jgi:hypothetical protein
MSTLITPELVAEAIDAVDGGPQAWLDFQRRHVTLNPAQRAELEALMRVATEVHALPQLEPSADFRRNARVRLLNRLRDRTPGVPVVDANGAAVTAAGADRSSSQTPSSTRRSKMKRWALVAASVAVLSSGGAVYASGSALPGDTLYPVKRLVEDVRVSTTIDPTGAATARAEARLGEATRLISRSRMLSITGDLTAVRQSLISLRAELLVLRARVPAETQSAIDEAIEAIDRAIARLDQLIAERGGATLTPAPTRTPAPSRTPSAASTSQVVVTVDGSGGSVIIINGTVVVSSTVPAEIAPTLTALPTTIAATLTAMPPVELPPDFVCVPAPIPPGVPVVPPLPTCAPGQSPVVLPTLPPIPSRVPITVEPPVIPTLPPFPTWPAITVEPPVIPTLPPFPTWPAITEEPPVIPTLPPVPEVTVIVPTPAPTQAEVPPAYPTPPSVTIVLPPGVTPPPNFTPPPFVTIVPAP